jgi:orotidine-5'-phosphate decarboxylase
MVQRQVLLSTEMTGMERFDAQVESWEVIFIERAARLETAGLAAVGCRRGRLR